MKNSLTILLALMTMMTVWSACQFDIANALLSAVSVPFLILGYIFSTIYDSENERAD